MSIRNNEPLRPRSTQNLVNCQQPLFSSEENTNLNIRNRGIHRNTRDRKTEHCQSHIRNVAEDPNLGTCSDWGFKDFLLLINIFHIIFVADLIHELKTKFPHAIINLAPGLQHNGTTQNLDWWVAARSSTLMTSRSCPLARASYKPCYMSARNGVFEIACRSVGKKQPYYRLAKGQSINPNSSIY